MAIITLYIAIGVMSASGSVYIAKSIFSAKIEQIFFALFLIPIAGFYLAFTAYFGDKDAWWVEATAVAVFAVFGLVGVRVSFALIVGYLLHGLWDAVHEFNALTGGSYWFLPDHIGPTRLWFIRRSVTYSVNVLLVRRWSRR